MFAGGTAVFAQNQVVLPNAGLTPNSPFYFLEVIVEEIGEFFTFNAEAKVKLQEKRAIERVAEVKAMLAKEEVNPERLNVALRRLQGHMERAANIIQRLVEQERNVETLATELDISFGFVNQHLKNVFEESKERMERAAELAEQALERRFAEPAFVQAMEDALLRIAADIDEDLGRPLDGFTVIEDETNVDVDDDTYSATHRAEAPQLMDLAALRDRILARGVENRWESGDVVLDDDSLDITFIDITFEKTYGAVDIMGEILFPYASVTISATQNSPKDGMTAINYDIDITLESESKHILDILEDSGKKLDDDFSNLSDVLKEQMDLKEAALNLVRELEEEKQELLDSARDENVAVPARVFGTFDSLLAQAKSALAAGNWEEAKRLAKQAEKELDVVEKAINDLAGAKEKETDRERGGCIISGCSNEVCSDHSVVSICIYLPEFACYDNAVCERQPDGQCDWTLTTAINQCLVEATQKNENSDKETCVDLCGDGICQEVVCMAIGCPCPETPITCPEDCE